MSALSLLSPRIVVAAFVLPVTLIALSPPAARAAAAATTTTLAIASSTGTVSSVAAGTAVSLTATVKAGTALVPSGSVNFCDASAAHCTDIHRIGTAQLGASGTAVLKLIPGPGVHSYKAEFVGTTSDVASNSAASSLTVNSALTTTAIAQSGSVGDYTLKATVTGKGSAAGPTGNVSFLDTSASNAVLGTATLGASTETFAWTTPQSPATAAEPQSVVAADFNGDGIPDLAVGTNATVATKNIGAIDILLGKGDGTFLATKSYSGLAGNQFIVAAPFVTGGPQDILAVNNSTATTGNGLLFLGDGKGGLGAGKTLSLGIDSIVAIITGDFNADGKLDFVVAGQAFGVPAFNVFLGNGDGTFNGGTLNATSDVVITALAAGDFTGQGYLDLAVVHSDGTVDIFLQDGAGDFYPNAGTGAGSSPTAIAIGDFNGDGRADLAITNSTQDNVSILLGKGDGTFTAAASPITGSLPTAIAVGDFNDDGIPDLATANSSAETVTILLGKGDGIFTVEPALNTGNTPIALTVGRFDSENTADIAVVNEDPASTSSTSTATVLLAQRTQTATASASGIAPTAAGAHFVDASYAGDSVNHASVSATTSLSGSAKQATAPVLSPAAGTYPATQAITLSDATPGAVIYYTTNGTAPTTASTRYTAPFKIAATETVDAIAAASGYTQSIVASAKYTIEASAAAPTFSVAAGTYAVKQTVTLADATAGAAIYYTLNGTTPTTASTKYTAAIPVAASETIDAIAVATGYANSAVASAKYVIETPAATPVFSPAAGTYAAAQSVKITSTTTGSTIYYTTNGTTPTTASTKYAAAISVAASETVKAIAVATGSTSSAVASAAYVIETATATPVFSKAAGTYTTTQSVTMTDATTGAAIYYTLNGTTPTTASTKYSTAITVAASETIKAIAVATGHTNSAVASAAYVIETPAAAPTFSPIAGTYIAAQSVKITSTTAGAIIYYTTNGTTPTTASTRYTAAITLAASETIKAISVDTGHTNSAVASAAYVIETPAATPVFSKAAGTYTSAQSVTISDATPGAAIYYTLNGTAPTTTSTRYTAAISVGTTETLEALAVASGHTNSAVASAKYTIETPAATPLFSPIAGTYTAAQSVKLSSSTTGAAIYYTTNGTTPTTASAKYAAAIAVSTSETIKAIAVATGYTMSAVASAAYVIETPAATPVFSKAAGTYTTAQSITISDATSGATIYYTTNGTAPTAASTKYSAAITVSSSETIKAIAVATGHTNSAVVSAAYTISAAGGAVAATPSSIAFPFANVNTSSAAQTVTFKNTSTTAITSLTVALTGTNATSYSKTQTCGTTLASGASCTVSVTFTPKMDGSFAATLQFTGTGASSAVSLSGTCGDPTSIAPDANTYVFNTTEGNIYVELRPDVAPKNVANFLYYVNNGTYTNSIIHRVVAGFINQGGGYKLNSDGQIIAPTTAAPVVNEFKLSNVRGTISMAKISNDPNSATDQFFFNAADNSSILDGQDGGYTVIGQIVGVQGANIGSASESLAVMDAINAVPTFAFQSPFDSIPLINYTSGESVTSSNYVYINSVSHYTAKTDGPATPIFSINTGTYAGPQTISLTDSTAGASIYYYLFGSNAATATKYTGPFTVSTSQYVVAYATAPGDSGESYYNYEYYDIVSSNTAKAVQSQRQERLIFQ